MTLSQLKKTILINQRVTNLLIQVINLLYEFQATEIQSKKEKLEHVILRVNCLRVKIVMIKKRIQRHP